eukprot:g3945.t1
MMTAQLCSRSCSQALWRGGMAGPRGARKLCSSANPKNGASSGSPWQQYLKLLETHPIMTKAVTSGVIGGIGDYCCQKWFDGRVDAKRLATFTFLGAALVGPTLHVWYGVLGRLLPRPGTVGAVQRMALDQGMFAPTFIPVFISSLMILEGKPISAVPGEVKKAWWPAVTGNWGIWIPAQLINFRFMPPNLQVLFANVVGCVWNVYLSWVAHGGAGESSAE